MQLTHYTSKFSAKQFPITVVCDHVSNAPNIGSLFRTCDAFGVSELIFCGTEIPLGRKMTKTSRATEKVVKYRVEPSIQEVITALKTEDYYIIALEITAQSLPLHNFKLNKTKPVAIIIGDENFGIQDSILKQCDTCIHIEMFGQNSSMNVVQATTATLYEITKQLL